MSRDEILVEGISLDDLMFMAEEEQDVLLAPGRPIVFRMGSAEILMQIELEEPTLVVVLSHIDAGGEGVLPALIGALKRLAISREHERIEWVVHAADCKEPNPKLGRVLRLQGFVEARHPEYGLAVTKSEVLLGSEEHTNK